MLSFKYGIDKQPQKIAAEIKGPALKKVRCSVGASGDTLVVFFFSYIQNKDNQDPDSCINASVYGLKDNEKFLYVIPEKKFIEDQQYHTDMAVNAFIESIAADENNNLNPTRPRFA